MIVPFLKEKRFGEMSGLAAEFRDKIHANFNASLQPQDPRQNEAFHALLTSTYSILALVKLLLAGELDVHPSREYALTHARDSGDAALFVAAMNEFRAEPASLDAMKNSYAKSVFTGFMKELQSDLLTAFVQCMAYNYRAAAIHLRCALEDLYRHLFYMHHPKEYQMLMSGAKDEMSLKLTPLAFRDYLASVDYLQPFSDRRQPAAYDAQPTDSGVQAEEPERHTTLALHSLNEILYGELSAAVHGSAEWFAAIESADSLQFNELRQRKLLSLFEKFNLIAVSFLAAGHRDMLIKMKEYDRSIILSCLTKSTRGQLRRLLNI